MTWLEFLIFWVRNSNVIVVNLLQQVPVGAWCCHDNNYAKELFIGGTETLSTAAATSCSERIAVAREIANLLW